PRGRSRPRRSTAQPQRPARRSSASRRRPRPGGSDRRLRGGVSASRDDRAGPFAILVFVIALAVRVGHVLALRSSPYFTRPVLDAETYYWAARGLAAGQGWAE